MGSGRSVPDQQHAEELVRVLDRDDLAVPQYRELAGSEAGSYVVLACPGSLEAARHGQLPPDLVVEPLGPVLAVPPLDEGVPDFCLAWQQPPLSVPADLDLGRGGDGHRRE